MFQVRKHPKTQHGAFIFQNVTFSQLRLGKLPFLPENDSRSELRLRVGLGYRGGVMCRRGLDFISLLKCDQAGGHAVMRVLTPCSLGSWACPSLPVWNGAGESTLGSDRWAPGCPHLWPCTGAPRTPVVGTRGRGDELV